MNSVSNDPSEIMLICCSRNISYYYQCWKQLYCFLYLCGNYDCFFRIIWLIKFNVSLLNSFSVFQQDIHSRVINSNFEVLAHYRKLRQALTDMNAQGWLNCINTILRRFKETGPGIHWIGLLKSQKLNPKWISISVFTISLATAGRCWNYTILYSD